MPNETSILSLPKELLSNISSWLDDRESCGMEVATKSFYTALSNPCGPPRTRLNLGSSWEADGPPTPRWLQKRIMRYKHIICDFSEATTLERSEDVKNGSANCIGTPLLLSLLSSCDPSAELHLSGQGENFMASLPGTIAPGVGSELSSSFWSDAQQRLTELTLEPPFGSHKAQLESLSVLTSLRTLSIRWGQIPQGYRGFRIERPSKIAAIRVTLRLPQLVYLSLGGFEEGELILSCPRLAEAWFIRTYQLCITIEEADLQSLVLINGQQLQFAAKSPVSQLQKLKAMFVSRCSEPGGCIIEDVALMPHLQTLFYQDFPAACMPTRFPQSLLELHLSPLDWHQGLPWGFKGLNNLKFMSFCPSCKSWDFTQPWDEFLPTESLEHVTLGSSKYIRENCGGKATFKRVL